jgi:hypothetical protein
MVTPLSIAQDGSFHGGVWRQAYTMNSTGDVAALLYFWDQGKPFVIALAVVLIAYMVAF